MVDLPETPDPTESEDWRADILRAVLSVVFALGLVVGGASVIYALTISEPLIALVDTVAITATGVLAHWRRLSYRQRAVGFLAVNYGLGVYFIFTVGIASQIYLIGFTLFTALLLGLRPAIATIGLVAVTLVTIALWAEEGPTIVMGDLGATGSRLVVILNLVFVSAVLAVSCAALLSRVERALDERRRAEAEATRLARVIEQSTEVVLIADPSGQVEYANRAHASLTEQHGPEARITHLDQLADLAASGATESSPVEAVLGRSQWTDTVVLPTAPEEHDGDVSAREFDTEITPIRAADGTVVNLVATLHDVTAERALERRLHRAEKLESLGTLASGVAHDFNNVITVILGLASELERTLDDEPGRHDASLIVAACGRARDVVRQMMTFGRRSPVSLRPQSLAEAVRETHLLLRAAIGTDVDIRSECASEGYVLAHEGDVSQILVNLVGNAAQAMAGQGGGTVNIRVTDFVPDADVAASHPRLRAGRSYLVLTVSDTGPGIAAAHLDRIFDPFFTTKSPQEGTGLGLASVHAIVANLAGEISVYSEPGRGTSFRIYLPEHVGGAPEADALPTPSPAAATQAPRETSSAALRILLVEDEPSLLEITTRALEAGGHHVVTAIDGQDACELFDAAPDDVDAVVTDLTMPRMGGVDLIRHVHAARPGLPVVLTSGFGEDSTDGLLSSLHLHAFLTKPFSRADLLGSLADVAVAALP